MPFTAPTNTNFYARFPRYAAVDSDLVDLLIAEAMRTVDTTWLEQDYAPAILYLAAHLYASESGGSVDRPGMITSESFGGMSTSYGQSGGRTDNYDTTEWGRRYKQLRNANFPGVLVV